MNPYDNLFADPSYSLAEPYKMEMVKTWAEQNNLKRLIDVGAGRGHYVKFLKEFQVTPVEPSKYACEHDLKDMHPMNASILTLNAQQVWDGLYCMDVLEHLSHVELMDSLKVLRKLAPRAMYGIANHSDVIGGKELHLIQEGKEWWRNALLNHYKEAEVVLDTARYMVLECSA